MFVCVRLGEGNKKYHEHIWKANCGYDRAAVCVDEGGGAAELHYSAVGKNLTSSSTQSESGGVLKKLGH